MRSQYLIYLILGTCQLLLPVATHASSPCATAWESAAQQIVTAGWASWATDINQAGCNIYQLQMRRGLEAQCPYSTAKHDADGDRYSAQNDFNQCQSHPPIGGCTNQANTVASTTTFASHVDQMEIWNNCKATATPVLINGRITKEDGSPIPNAVVSFTNYGPTAISDSSGLYSAQVVQGYTGTAKPALGGYLFTPASRSYNNVQTIQTNQDYSAQQPYTTPRNLVSGDNEMYDRFGASVALEGSTLVAGAPGAGSKAGAAYVFSLSGATWVRQAKLTGDLPYFGTSVALSGDTVAVGTCNAQGAPEGCTAGGAVYVFVRSGGNWSRQAKLVTPDTTKWSSFGMYVALSGNTLAVGPYIYQRSGGSWTLQTTLTPPSKTTFGWAVSLSGDTLAVAGSDSNANKAAVFVYVRSGSSWTLQAEITAPTGAGGFGNVITIGTPIALKGDTLLVGAISTAVGANDKQGAAYIYDRINNMWTLRTQISATNGQSTNWFGNSVALDGAVAVAGAPSYSIVKPSGATPSWTVAAGMADVFFLANGSWTEAAALIATSPGAYDWMGTSVAADNGLVAVGAPTTGSSTSAYSRGSVYVYGTATNDNKYTLVLQPSPPSGGSVTANPPSASGTYAPSTTVQLTATSNPGYQFAGWAGDVSGMTNPLTVTINGPMSIMATFTAVAPSQFTVTANASPATGGSVSKTPPMSTSYTAGTSVTLTATANAGCRFTGWSGDLSGTVNPQTVAVNKALNITANFTCSNTSPSPVTLLNSAQGGRAVAVDTASNWVLSQFADGASWQSTIVLANRDTSPITCRLDFLSDSGNLMQVQVETAAGAANADGARITVPAGGSAQIQTAGKSDSLSQGVAILTIESGSAKNLAGLGIFRALNSPRPAFEAIVPMVNPNARELTLPFDNANNFAMGLALFNGDSDLSLVDLEIHDESGMVLYTGLRALAKYSHTAFVLADEYPVTAGKRGLIMLKAGKDSLAALGLRFSPDGAFTSFPALF
jgi:hypothetical protein